MSYRLGIELCFESDDAGDLARVLREGVPVGRIVAEEDP